MVTRAVVVLSLLPKTLPDTMAVYPVCGPQLSFRKGFKGNLLSISFCFFRHSKPFFRNVILYDSACVFPSAHRYARR